MKKLKFTTVHKNTGDYFRVVVIPYEQQQFYIIKTLIHHPRKLLIINNLTYPSKHLK